MLTQLNIEGFKRLRKVEIQLTPLTVLVGPNGVGKSTALEALEVLGRWAQKIKSEELKEEEIHSWSSQHIKKSIQKINDTRLSTKSIKIYTEIVKNKNISKSFYTETTKYPGEPCSTTVLSNKDYLLKENKSTTNNTYKISSVHFFPSLRYLKLDVRKLRAPSPAANGIMQMDEEGGGLATRLQYLTGLRDGSIERIEAGLQRLVPEVRRIFTVPQEIEVEARQTVTINGEALVHRELRKVGGVGLEVEIAGAGRIPAAQLSEGTLLALGLLTALEEPGVDLLLMDDAERGLHPGAQQKLIAMLRELQAQRPELQLILSTHSPDLVDACAPEEVQVFGRNAQGEVEVHPLTAHAKAGEWLGVLRVGEFWSSVGEDWIRERSAAEGGEDAVADR